MILLTIFLLLASDCDVKVHREPIGGYSCWFLSDGQGWSTPCENPEHYHCAKIVQKCDTVWYGRTLVEDALNASPLSDTVIITCHPETLLVDSGVNTLRFEPTKVCTLRIGEDIHPSYLRWMASLTTPPDTARLPDYLDSAELADIREMLREWPKYFKELKALRRQLDFRTCLDTLKIEQQYFWKMDGDTIYTSDTLPHSSVKDSCSCVYGKGKP